ncbi:hypothetical protein AB6A40_006636 [Gnathostoma spinigerum]|uniref:Methyltransferase-like protein 17, mitochondrial n=1 Tax=Gnathostoma spinigerum TaxID=75299 RepID=A0ABD6ETQ5_9BILA
MKAFRPRLSLFGRVGHRCINSASASLVVPSTSAHINLHYENGCCHVVSCNPVTSEHYLLQLRMHKDTTKRPRYDIMLPSEAVEGLKNALIRCSRSPKQLQHEADRLYCALEQRRFPASPAEVREARKQIETKLKEDFEHFLDDDSFNEKIQKGREEYISQEVDKLLKRAKYNWKPLDFDSREAAAIYCLARLSANYAEIHRVLQELPYSEFTPESVLDYGSGSGAGFWASHMVWGKKVKEYHLVEPIDELSRFAVDIMRGSGDGEQRPLVHPNVILRRHLIPSPSHCFDVVIAHRVLCELPSHEDRNELIKTLWNRTNRYLIIIDSDKQSSFEAVLEARDFILVGGNEVHADETRELLSNRGLLTEEVESILNDSSISHFERVSRLEEKLPTDIVLPTRLPRGFVFAPCPHDQGCPKLGTVNRNNCSFSTRWRELRADGKRSSSGDGTSLNEFSYVIMEKGTRGGVDGRSRILKKKSGSGRFSCTLCTPFSGIQHFVVPKKAGLIYKATKNRKAGELFPCKIETLATESEFDTYFDAIKEVEQNKEE